MKLLLTLITFLFFQFLYSWDGYDWDSNSHIEIDEGNLVRPGETIEIYEYGKGYTDVEVQSIDSYGGSTEVEIYDYNTGEYRTFDMD